MKLLITGTAGFIGFHLVKHLLKHKYQIVGLDNINSYYDVNLKYARLAETGIYSPEEEEYLGGKKRVYKEIDFGTMISSSSFPSYRFIRLNLEDKAEITELFRKEKFECVINLAAQAGVRYSIEKPEAYIQSNIVGFSNILEACRHYSVKHLVYASSSSVYGGNTKVPFSEDDQVDHPVSLYAATKKSNELMACTYSHLYNLQVTGLRFFTVYGPWGRPDMAPMLFAKAIMNNEPIKVFNNGEMERDFTYIDDIIKGISKIIITKTNSTIKSKIYNIGNGAPVGLLRFIEILEKNIGKDARKNFLPMQQGDVKRTWADTSKLQRDIKYRPAVLIEKGVREFIHWYKLMYK
nr:NAD-dependent epimerase/dehydratase family protein [uncultured Draconibacterium sp.]